MTAFDAIEEWVAEALTGVEDYSPYFKIEQHGFIWHDNCRIRVVTIIGDNIR